MRRGNGHLGSGLVLQHHLTRSDPNALRYTRIPCSASPASSCFSGLRRSTTSAGSAVAARLTTAATCAADLGQGVKTSRQFCDVIIATTSAESVAMAIPAAHRDGDADVRSAQPLHRAGRRSRIPRRRSRGTRRSSRSSGPPGERDRARGRRSRVSARVQDLFDRIGGGARPGGVQGGRARSARSRSVSRFPRALPAIGIVGVRLEVHDTRGEARPTTRPGAPIAIVSNLRIEYTPR